MLRQLSNSESEKESGLYWPWTFVMEEGTPELAPARSTLEDSQVSHSLVLPERQSASAEEFKSLLQLFQHVWNTYYVLVLGHREGQKMDVH